MKKRIVCLLIILTLFCNMGGVAFAQGTEDPSLIALSSDDVMPMLPEDDMMPMLPEDDMMPMLPGGGASQIIPEAYPPVDAETSPSPEEASSSVDWKVENGVLTISKKENGTGIMDDYSMTRVTPWYSEYESITAVVISEGITEIGDFSFYCLNNIKSVTFPSTVTKIGEYAFGHCIYLPEITIPNTITDIGMGAFINCGSLKSAVIEAGSSPVTLGSYALYFCKSLEKVSIPANVTSLGDYVFGQCYTFESAGPIGSNSDYEFGWTTAIPDRAFEECIYIETVELPDAITSIGSWAFSNCLSLESITLPATLESIGEYAFSGSGLTSIDIPQSVTAIGRSAFANCADMQSANVPAGVTALNAYAFAFCDSLENIYFDGDAPSIAANAFEGVGQTDPESTDRVTAYAHYIPGRWTSEQLQDYGGKLVWTPYIKGIEVTALPNKQLYYKGESFDPTGLVVSAVAHDGTASPISEGFAMTGFDSSSGGEKVITLSYGGRTTTFSVYVFSFTSVTLSLDGRVIINFYANFPGVDALGYTPGILFFTASPSSEDIAAAYSAGKGVASTGTAADGSLLFSYNNTAAKEMNDLIYAVLYAQHSNGSVIFGTPSSISVAQYVGMVFNSYKNDTALQKLMVDMLNYGTAAQNHFGYKTSSLASSSLTSDQKKLGTSAAPTLNNNMKLYNDELSNSAVVINSASLSLDNEITINFYAKISDLKVAVPKEEAPDTEGGDEPESGDPEGANSGGEEGGQEPPQSEFTVYPVEEAKLLLFKSYSPGGTYDLQSADVVSSMVKSGDYYAGFIPNIAAKSMRDLYYARVYVKYANGNEAYSGIGQYSVETYAHTVKNSSGYSANLKALTESMMKYGDSAAAYFSKAN